MSTKKKKNTREKKLVTFLLDEDIRGKVDEYCKKQQLSLAQFIRNAIISFLEPQVIQEVQVQGGLDEGTFKITMNGFRQEMSKMTQMMEFLVDQERENVSTSDDTISEAKELLQAEKPATYEEAAKLIPDINTMQEAINQLLKEEKVKYIRRRLSWQ